MQSRGDHFPHLRRGDERHRGHRESCAREGCAPHRRRGARCASGALRRLPRRRHEGGRHCGEQPAQDHARPHADGGAAHLLGESGRRERGGGDGGFRHIEPVLPLDGKRVRDAGLYGEKGGSKAAISFIRACGLRTRDEETPTPISALCGREDLRRYFRNRPFKAIYRLYKVRLRRF